MSTFFFFVCRCFKSTLKVLSKRTCTRFRVQSHSRTRARETTTRLDDDDAIDRITQQWHHHHLALSFVFLCCADGANCRSLAVRSIDELMMMMMLIASTTPLLFFEQERGVGLGLAFRYFKAFFPLQKMHEKKRKKIEK